MFTEENYKALKRKALLKRPRICEDWRYLVKKCSTLAELLKEHSLTTIAYNFAIYVLEGHNEEIYKIISESTDAYHAYFYCREVLKRHDEALYKVIVEHGEGWAALWYMRDILKRHDDALSEVVKKDDKVLKEYEKIFGVKEAS